MTDLSSEASATTGASAGPGRLIRKAREQAGLSIEDLGAQIKLARGTLDALERDDFRTLSEPVYVRGYYRKLSKVLPVSEAELLSAYESQVTPKVPVAPPSKLILSGETDIGDGNSKGLKLVVGVVIAGIVIGALAFWGSTRTAAPAAEVVPTPEPAVVEETAPPPSGLSTSESLAEPPTGAELTLTPPPTATPSSTPPVSATLTLAPTLSQLPAPAPATTPAPTPAPVSTPAAQPTPLPLTKPVSGRAEVQLQFNSTSWTRIEDASGKSLLSGVIQAGDRQTLSGEAPFSIFLGNAPGVAIQFNGQQVDMAKYTKGNNTARFTLP